MNAASDGLNDDKAGPKGTRFRLFPQAPVSLACQKPVTISLSPPVGSIGPGPADDRILVVDPIGRHDRYGAVIRRRGSIMLNFPPWRGPRYATVRPGPDGHFDHLEPDTPEFEVAHAYACIRFVMDVWEGYFGRTIPWHFEQDYERLEVILNRNLDNAAAGWGFIEVGAHFPADGPPLSFALNFDVLAHEVGHLIVYSQVGLPLPGMESGEYLGFHEAAADLVALLAAASLEAVVEELFANSRGNLYLLNELNRFAELSPNEEIRLASNDRRLVEFRRGWSDEHDLSQPLTGALFDILVDLFHEHLVERRLIPPVLEDLADQGQDFPDLEPQVQAGFDAAYAGNEEAFKQAFADARDRLGFCLARVLETLSPNRLNYSDVIDALLVAERELSSGRYARLIQVNAAWRGIGRVRVGPRLPSAEQASHAHSVRTIVPDRCCGRGRPTYRARWAMARSP